MLQVVVTLQGGLVARVAHPTATMALLERLAHASDAGAVHLDQTAAGMVAVSYTHLITLSFCNPYGKFLAGVQGFMKGNILLRREQYRWACLLYTSSLE